MNINPLQIMQMMNNPKNFAKQMLSNSQAMQNPMIRNAMDMASKGDSKGVEKLARNICTEKGINPDEAIAKIKSQFGM